MTWIDFRQFSGAESAFSHLFIDYVSDFSKVARFYAGDFRSEKDWQEKLQHVSTRYLDRSALVQVLSAQNRDFHCGIKTLSNIDSLSNENTLAVVTGQQLGLFTGPLYTIYKTLTAIKLVEQLRERYPTYSFVPVFWLEGDDHDFAEVGSISVLTPDNTIQKLTYQPSDKVSERKPLPVGDIEITESITEFMSAVDKTLAPTEFHPGVLELFRTAYQRGMTFTRSFVHLMNVFFEDSGLIFINPRDPNIKRMLIPVFEKEIAESPRACQLVIGQSELLEQQYHAQVKPRPMNLFYTHHAGRFPLEPVQDGFVLKGSRQHLSKDEVHAALKETPEVFSPNVVLRPLCQDSLLPTVAYVAGPAEISYFAQLRPLYEDSQLPQPILYPRASATILEERIEKVLNRFDIAPGELFQETEFLKQKVADKLSDFKVSDLFASTQGAIDESLNSLRSGLQSIDPTLVGALDNSRGKIRLSVDLLRDKALAAQKRQHETALRQIDKAAMHLFPNSNFQERELNVVYYLNKYGREFVRWLAGEIQIDKFKHQIIRL